MKTRKVKTSTLPDCPEFRPTLAQMQDFQAYILECEKATNAGMFKVLKLLIRRFYLQMIGSRGKKDTRMWPPI